MPRPIHDFFHVPRDETLWVDEPRYIGNKPNREQHLMLSEMLVPHNDKATQFFGEGSDTNYGIYILMFPSFDKFYVGIAARYSKYIKKNHSITPIKNPEGILQRLRKHRAKCTGSFSMINHTNVKPYGWQDFAIERYSKLGPGDNLGDCLLGIITIGDHYKYREDDKGLLEQLENNISSNGLDEIYGNNYASLLSISHTLPKEMTYSANFTPMHFPDFKY